MKGLLNESEMMELEGVIVSCARQAEEQSRTAGNAEGRAGMTRWMIARKFGRPTSGKAQAIPPSGGVGTDAVRKAAWKAGSAEGLMQRLYAVSKNDG